jgi:hypothetical protein
MYESSDDRDGGGGGAAAPLLPLQTASSIKVAKLVDTYLAEIAPDANLKLSKFLALAELLPDYARTVDDGLYRAIDIYLKVDNFFSPLPACLPACLHDASDHHPPRTFSSNLFRSRSSLYDLDNQACYSFAQFLYDAC